MHYKENNMLSTYFSISCDRQAGMKSSRSLIAEDDVDDGIDVGNVDLAVVVDVGSWGCWYPRQDDVDDDVDIGDIDLSVAVHITTQALDTRAEIVRVERLHRQGLFASHCILIDGELDVLDAHRIGAHIIGATHLPQVKQDPVILARHEGLLTVVGQILQVIGLVVGTVAGINLDIIDGQGGIEHKADRVGQAVESQLLAHGQ